MLYRWIPVIALSAMLGFATSASFAAEPSLQQVHQAAEAGNFREAQAMMDQVLRDHPNSGKAHFVEAELLAKQGRIASAKAEFDTAQQLAPGLPFAKPDSVQELRARLTTAPASMNLVDRAPAQAPSFPWGLLWVGVALVAAMIFFFRRRTSPVNIAPSSGALGGFGPAAQPYGYGNGAPMGPMGGGSGILGSLATGAALGAGMVAGESLVHRMLDGNHQPSNNFFPGDNSVDAAGDYDMGGNDFGVADGSSWDDGAGGGDWS